MPRFFIQQFSLELMPQGQANIPSHKVIVYISRGIKSIIYSGRMLIQQVRYRQLGVCALLEVISK